MNYYKRHVGDYAISCGHLSMLEHGAYALILDSYYKREHGPTLAEAFKWARARSQEETDAVHSVLSEFFTLDLPSERFLQSRVEEELAQFRVRQQFNREVGARGGRAKRKESEALSEPLSDDGAKRNPSHKPLAINHKEAESKAARASRLPADWKPSTDAMTWTATQQISWETCQRELDAFRDYWKAMPGARGTKLDWDATFRNWIRKASANGNHAKASAADRVTRNILSARAQRAVAGGTS